jgi:hypothetical protein
LIYQSFLAVFIPSQHQLIVFRSGSKAPNPNSNFHRAVAFQALKCFFHHRLLTFLIASTPPDSQRPQLLIQSSPNLEREFQQFLRTTSTKQWLPETAPGPYTIPHLSNNNRSPHRLTPHRAEPLPQESIAPQQEIPQLARRLANNRERRTSVGVVGVQIPDAEPQPHLPLVNLEGDPLDMEHQLGGACEQV